MFSKEHIKNLKHRIPSTITHPKKWGIILPRDEYQKIAKEYDKWAFEMSDFIDERYGKGSGDIFRSLFRVQECFLALNAGFKIDTDALTKIIKNTRPDSCIEFYNEPVVDKLAPTREAISLIALASKIVRDAKFDYDGKPEKINTVIKAVDKEMDQILALYAKDQYIITLPYERLLEEADSRFKDIEVATERRLTFLQKLTPVINKEIYKAIEEKNEETIEK